MEKRDQLDILEYRRWLHEPCSPNDPYYDEWMAGHQAYQDMYNDIAVMTEPGRQAMKQADQIAEGLIEMAKKASLEDFINLPPIPAIAALSLIAKADEQSKASVLRIGNERQSAIAQKERPRSRNKAREEIRLLWSLKRSEFASDAEFLKYVRPLVKSTFSDSAYYRWIKKWAAGKN